MKSDYFRYWGKARPVSDSSQSAKYHLLVYHCLDVAAVGRELILNYPSCKTLIKGLNISINDFADIFAFFLCLHDLGKFSISFQSLVVNLSSDLVKPNISKIYDIRHDSLGYLLWEEKLEAAWFENPCYPVLKENERFLKSIFKLLIKIVTGHHGVPSDNISNLVKRNSPIEAYFNPEDIQAAQEFLQVMSALFLTKPLPEAFLNREYKEIWKLASWPLNGIAVLADWLGSDQEIFSYCDTPVNNLAIYWQKIQSKAKQALQQAGLNAKIQSITFTNATTLFPHINSLSPLQQECVEIELAVGPQLFILEDTTGAGKTEAALILAQRLMGNNFADGIYIGLPTMATANGMYERIGKVYDKLYSDESQPSLVLSHSKGRLSKKFNQSLGLSDGKQIAEANYSKDEQTAPLWCNQWFADNRKKALLAHIGVGTLDQALLSVLPVKHQSLRLLGLSRKILIADEIHAYDFYTSELLAILIEAHARHGGSIILLSATLTQALREKLTKAFHAGLGILETAPLLAQTFPLLTQVSENPIVKEIPIATRQLCKRQVKIKLLAQEKAIQELILTSISAGKCVCWIRNTVKDANETFNQMTQLLGDKKDKLTLFHSRFAMVDRLCIEEKVNRTFGKFSDSLKRKGQILIATQVVEQSLDLDFDVLISDLAPIDLLIQRAGRLHRHLRDADGNCILLDGAQDKRGRPIFYIYGPEPTNEPEENWLQSILPGTQAIYPDVAKLWLTQQILLTKGEIIMPEQARDLIEGVYNEAKQFKQIPEVLATFSEKAKGKEIGDISMAYFNALAINRGYCWDSAEFDGWSKKIETPTRLSETETMEVMLAILTDDQITAYAGDTVDFPWDMSSLSLNKKDVANLVKKTSGLMQAKINELIAVTPQLKNYSCILLMMRHGGTQRYSMYDASNGALANYCPQLGFQLEPTTI